MRLLQHGGTLLSNKSEELHPEKKNHIYNKIEWLYHYLKPE